MSDLTFAIQMAARAVGISPDQHGLDGAVQRMSAEITRLRGEVENLKRLNTEIHEAKDALAKMMRTCACTEFDDGSAFHLGSFAGGAAPGGAYAYVRCVERKPDGTEVVHHYVPADEDEGTDKAEALVGQVPYDEDMALDHGHGD